MTTNSTEYMRKYQRERRAKIKADANVVTVTTFEKSLQENVKKSVKIVKIGNLNPPKVENRFEGDRMVEQLPLGADPRKETHSPEVQEATDSKTFAGIDFSYLTNNSSFQRGIMEFFKKYAPGLEKIKVRGSKENLLQSFDKNRRELLKELKEVLKRRNES